MSDAFETSRQKTNVWLKDVAQGLGGRKHAYAALRSVLHALRDCLPLEEAAKLAAQMPMVLTGVYFDGWKPRRKPLRLSRQEFLLRVKEECPGEDPEFCAKAVFQALNRRFSAGEIEAARRVLPHDVRDLWYELGHAAPEEPAAVPEGSLYGSDEVFRVYEPGSHGAPAWP